MRAKIVPVGVSVRHVHLTLEHIAVLFGERYQLTPLKSLSQPGQFAAEETVTISGPKGAFEKVRILGPAREASQVEISKSDAFLLGLRPPVRESGFIDGTPGLTVIGPAGEVELARGAIIAARHIHLHTRDAVEWGIADGQLLRVRVEGERALVFDNVIARVSEHFALDMHIDTDEGNAAGLTPGDTAVILDE